MHLQNHGIEAILYHYKDVSFPWWRRFILLCSCLSSSHLLSCHVPASAPAPYSEIGHESECVVANPAFQFRAGLEMFQSSSLDSPWHDGGGAYAEILHCS